MAIGDKQKLITEIVSEVLGEQAQDKIKFEWFINKHTKENFGKYFATIDNIFKSLNGDTIKNQSKRLVPLKCDAFFGGKLNFIFEFDEFQHFSSARLKTFECYPSELKLNFSLEEWEKLCAVHKDRADKYRHSKTTPDFDFPGGRTAQRAYMDCFRDFLPEIQGLNPTLRINEFEVIDIYSINKYSYNKIEKILNKKLSY
ncbi:hypothetical protein AGMMS49574_02760 [Bacteroidia bacterium]|nr:hypothetical protein AGMMS49574_02760 [Bacteroidia bacterium]